MKNHFYQLLMPTFWPLWCAIGIIRLIILLPYPWMIKTGQLLGYLVFWLQRSKKKLILENNLIRYFPQLSKEERAKLSLMFYQNLVIGSLETALAWWEKPSKWQAHFILEGQEHLHQALKLGKGVIILYCHHMSFELIGRFMATQAPLSAVYRPNKNLLLNYLMCKKRQSFLKHLMAKHQVKRLLQVLKNNGVVAIAPDQSMKEPFGNLPSKNIVGLIKMTEMTGATILPFTCHRDVEAQTYSMKLLPPLEKNTTAICQFLKQSIEAYPEQYLWLQRKIRIKESTA